MKTTTSLKTSRRYFSLFSGVGGFELAINNVYENKSSWESLPEQARSREHLRPIGDKSDNKMQWAKTKQEEYLSENNCECVGFSEIDKYAISVYQYHYQSHKNYGDIKNIDWNTVPDFDLLVGGSPCQDLSVAGKQKGLAGARSGLFFEFIRCLKEKQPTNFIWENVKGALSSSSGWDFARVQIEFSEVGYDTEWQVLNAKDFGVPQNRERVFVVGHLRGKSEPKVFPITTNNGATTQGNTEQNLVAVDRGILKPRTTINALDANYYKGINNHQARTGVIKQVNQPTHSNDRVYSNDGISPSLNTMQGGRRQPKILDDYNHRIKNDGIVPAVRQTFGHGSEGNGAKLVIEPKIRRLTPLECERLMSWPDDWTKYGIGGVEISDTQRYKMCGNGVVSKVVEAIIERL